MLSPPHSQAEVMGTPKPAVTLAFLVGIKEMVSESPPHSKPLRQATMAGLEMQGYIQSGLFLL